MNSVYEAPRSAPKPTSGPIPTKTLVSEVSMIFDSEPKRNDCSSNDSVYLSYKAWKERNQDKLSTTNTKQPLTPAAPTKKMQPFEEIYMANMPNRHLDLSIIEPPQRTTNREIGTENINPNVQLAPTSPYMANMPNRHLDLSIIKPPQRTTNREIATDNINPNVQLAPKSPYDYESWRLKQEALCNSNRSGVASKNHIIDLYNYKKDVEPTVVSAPKHQCNCSKNQSDDVTVKELLKIIQQQNEQLLILQKQVATLISNKETESKEIRSNAIMFEDHKTSTQVENPYSKPSQFLPKKGPMHQISVDVMTSFELSIRRPTNPKLYDAVHHQPKICEVTETESNDMSGENILDGIAKPRNVTLSLNEPQLQIPERCPTPVSSISIDMKDYSSDSSDAEEEQPYPDWTFYNNIMTQVNHILKESGVRPSSVASSGPMRPGDIVKQNMMKKVKETTVRHLRNIGVHVPSENVDNLHTGPNKEVNSNEISFAVQQLLMKYLPNEHLAKLTNKQNFPKPKQTGRIKRRPEFSMATVQYMQKYNLLNDNPNPAFERDNFDRILDATAIRQQPKLL